MTESFQKGRGLSDDEAFRDLLLHDSAISR